jgi:hypothetical protein
MSLKGQLKEFEVSRKRPPEVKTLYLEKFGLNLEKHNGAGRWELPIMDCKDCRRAATDRQDEGT